MALHILDGEQVVAAVLGHSFEDDALYFYVLWSDDSQSEEPLENLVDTHTDWLVN